MAEKYRFFDSTEEDERVYTADEFAEYFRRVLTDGIFNGGTNLKVEASGTNIQTYIQPGYAWLQGYMYKVDADPLYLTHDLPHATYNRIDRVVIRLDKRLENRYVRAFVKKGTPASNPVPPSLTRNENVFEISLAQVRIIKGKSYIEGFQITDERLNTSVCGLVNSLIQADTTEIFNQFQAWYNSKTAQFQQEWSGWLATATAQFGQEWTTWFNSTKSAWNTWFGNVQDTGFETPAGAQAKVDAHANATSVHGATSVATASRIIMRDANGRAKVAAPSAADDIARKDTVDSHANRTDNPHNVTTAQVNYIGSKAPTELSTVYPGGYSLSYIIPTDSNYNAWVDLANSLMGSAYSYDNTLMFVLKTDKATTNRGFTQELVILSNFTASSGQIWGVYKRSVSAYASPGVWGPWVRVDRGITYGTANPRGGRDGDVYFQYE